MGEALRIPRRTTSGMHRDGMISHERAREAALRLIHSHFGLPDEARMHIPAQTDDDDLVIMDYIAQQIFRELQAEAKQA
jgi:hypothetical protein